MKKKFIILACLFIFAGLSWALLKQIPETAQAHLDVDSKAYVKRAELFVSTGDVVEDGDSVPYYPLGYPLFVGFLYKLFGCEKIVVVCTQIILCFFSIMTMFFLASFCFNNTVATIATIFMTFNLGNLVFAQFILAETILSFLLLLFFTQMMRFFNAYDVYDLFLAGIVLGFSVLFKPAALYYPLILSLIIFFVGKIAIVKRFKNTGIFLIAFILPLGSYVIYNKVTHDTFYLTSMTNINLQLWFFPHVLAHNYKTDVEFERAKLTALFDRPNGSEKIAVMMKKAYQKNPLLFGLLWMKNVAKTWLGLFSSNLKVLMGSRSGSKLSFFSQKGSVFEKISNYITGGTTQTWISIVAILEVIWSIIRYVFFVIGYVFFVRRKQWTEVIFLLSYLAYFSMITGHDGCARFRMMFEFVVILIAAFGVYEMLVFSPRTKKKILV